MKHIFQQYPVVIPLFIAIIVQIIKIIIDVTKTKHIYRRNVLSAGGFPSVHSAISTSVTTLVGIEYGAGSMLFAVAFTFTFLFIYDAMNVRYEAGKHAHYINNLRFELEATLHKQAPPHHLKERLGHTPIEVIGSILFGCILTLLLSKFIVLW